MKWVKSKGEEIRRAESETNENKSIYQRSGFVKSTKSGSLVTSRIPTLTGGVKSALWDQNAAPLCYKAVGYGIIGGKEQLFFPLRFDETAACMA